MARGPTTGMHFSQRGTASRGQARFASKVDEWVMATQQRVTAVLRESARRVIEEMQRPVNEGGNMPIDTGFLRASLVVVVNGNPPIANRISDGRRYAYNASTIVLEIAKFNAGDRMVAAYTANYARHLEYGSQGRAGRGFTRLASQQWGRIVQEVTAEAKARVPARGR